MAKNYDSDFCGNLPLNFINSIQMYGVLFVMDKQWRIIQVSENTEIFLQNNPSYFLNKNLSSFLNTDLTTELKNKLKGTEKNNIPFTFNMTTDKSEVSLLGIIHQHEKYLILEMEVNKPSNTFNFIYHDIKKVISRLQTCLSFQDILNTVAKEIKDLSGLDKVLIYQFDKEWNGLVMAEAKEDFMDAYLGLHFPASDVPKQARELYLRNPYRFIPDRSSKAIKLIPILNPLTFSFTDLSDCNLRAVAPVHLEYLANMGVEMSMSIPIIKENHLWGLISCHHGTSKLLNYEMRSAFELLSQFISTQLMGKENEKLMTEKLRIQEFQASIFKKMTKEKNINNILLGPSPNVLDLLELTGCIIISHETITTAGKVPSKDFINHLLYSFKVKKVSSIIYSDSFSLEMDPDGLEKEFTSGLIFIPMAENYDECIIGFREEFVNTVKWGGNPNEAIVFEEDKKTYHPRNSFNTWQETLKGTSLPWKKETIDAAEELKSTLQNSLIKA